MRTATLAAVLALTGCAGGELTDTLYPGNVPFDDEERPSHLVVKVLDDATGEPIPGATVSLVDEATYPIPEAPPAPARTATADADGWIRVAIDDLRGRYSWLYFSADGYGPQGVNAQWIDRAVRLREAVDVPFEIRDEMDRPVAGAQIDWHLGCGHTPAVRIVKTDANGQATLAGIDLESGEGWIKSPGLHSDYLDLNWEPGAPRAVIHVASAPVRSGRVVDAAGKPVAGAVVGANFRHRGPWCVTGADGAFQLVGLERGASVLGARSLAHPHTVEGSPSPAGHGCTLRLPPDGEKAPGWKPGRKVHVRVIGETKNESLADIEVTVVRKSDGATVSRIIQPEGQALFGEPSTGDARFDLQAGEYEIVLEHARGLYLPLMVPLTVTGGVADAPHKAEFTVSHAPLKKLEFNGVPKHATVWVATPGRPLWDLTEEAQQAGLIPLPADGPAVLKLSADNHSQYVVIERGKAPQTITWNGPPPVDPTTVEWEPPSDEMPELPSSTLTVTVELGEVADADAIARRLTVSIDGEPYRGKAPGVEGRTALTVQIAAEHLPHGAREVVVSAPGFLAYRNSIRLTKDRASTLVVSLTPASR